MRHSDETPDVALGYDPNSNLVSMADGHGTETYSYDALNRPTTVMRGADVFSYQYDLAGNVLASRRCFE